MTMWADRDRLEYKYTQETAQAQPLVIGKCIILSLGLATGPQEYSEGDRHTEAARTLGSTSM